jgi:hypothetical protein
VLFGDAPAKRTQALQWSATLGKCGVSFVKVAHHGAIDGTTAELLDQLILAVTPMPERTAVLTPFRAQGLPRSEVVQLLEEKGFHVRISGNRDRASGLTKTIEEEFGPDSSLIVEWAIAPQEAVVRAKFECG